MAGRRTDIQKILAYMKRIDEAHQSSDGKYEDKTAEQWAVEWVGTAKVKLKEEQAIRVLFLIYAELNHNNTALNWMAETYPHLFKLEELED